MEESKQNKIVLLRQMIENAERNIVAAKQILSQLDSGLKKPIKNTEISQVIEGAFDGEKMIGLDGKSYPIPANYASKSKLVDGDLLKLSITEDGRFLYKQISPIDRRKIIGTVMKENNKYYALSEGKKYEVLLASLTYFKAKEGDEVTLVVPKEKISEWAAIEAVMDDTKKDENNLENLNDENKQKEYSPQESMEDEWLPDLEEMKKEASFDENKDDRISDDFS
jgi:hypothetical protein